MFTAIFTLMACTDDLLMKTIVYLQLKGSVPDFIISSEIKFLVLVKKDFQCNSKAFFKIDFQFSF